jgi:hypothetical protein
MARPYMQTCDPWMLHRIIDLIIQEDTFGLFTNKTPPNIFEVIEQPPKIKRFEELDDRLVAFFRNILRSVPEDSLYFNEASRMLSFVERIFGEYRETGDAERDGQMRDRLDDLVDAYAESITSFVQGIDIPILQEHVRYIIS